MRSRTGQILLHLTGCIAFLSLPVLLSPDVSWDFRFIKLPPFREEFITYTLLLLFFYLNYFWLIPNLYFRQRFLSYTGCILLVYITIALLPHLLVPDNHKPADHGAAAGKSPVNDKHHAGDTVHAFLTSGPEPSFFGNDNPPPGAPAGKPPINGQGISARRPPPPPQAFQNSPPPPNGRGVPNRPDAFWKKTFFLFPTPRFEYLFQFMMVLVLSSLIRINNRLKQSEKEKVNAELAYLKAQINPHFLFNTLNSIYASAIGENADHTASAVVKLSGMMRYVISEAHQQYVPLQKEIDYITDYIDLQKIRLGNTVQLEYAVKGTATGKEVAPLILITFIENAFKHGVNPEQQSAIAIDIDVQGSALHLSVRNRKVSNVNTGHLKNNIGLDNTASRLQLLYPSRHELTIKEDKNEFLVLLKLNLQ